jgi:hypothetical protein
MIDKTGRFGSMTEREPPLNASRSILPRQLRISIFAFATTLSVLLASCGSFGSDDDSGEFWSPFTSQSAWEVGDGRVIVELSGHERGHEPGKTAEFTVTIENRREVDTELEICAKLIDERQIVQRFDQFIISIEPEDNEVSTFEVTLEEDVEPRAYGFAVVVGDIGSIIHTIRVGIPDDEAGPWLDADELVCD